MGGGGKTECPDPSSFIVSEDGAVYVWGSGGEGQLGMGGKTECPDPEELRIEEGVTCISCGYYHTALVSGRCYLDVLVLELLITTKYSCILYQSEAIESISCDIM